MRQYLHISFHWKNGDNKIDQLKTVFDANADDWLRYASNCWVVWTWRSPQQWFDILRPYLTDDDYALIVRLDISVRQGWLPQWMWDWIAKPRY